MTDIAVRVEKVVADTPDVRTLLLVREDGLPLGPYEAGAHVDVVGPTGIRRQYSLCGPPDERGSFLVAVKREPESRGGSAALHTVAEGDVLSVGEPRSLLRIAPGPGPHLLVGGGIGITPMISLAYALHAAGAPFELHHVAGPRERACLVGLLEAAPFRDRVHLHLGVPREDRAPALAAAVARTGPDGHVYVCGPEAFMAHVAALAEPVVGAGHVHVEHFRGADEPADAAGDRPVTVELDTGEVYEVPADRSILSVLQENGVDVATSCEEGVCGSCVSGVLEGEPDHRDRCLSAADRAAGDRMALCVSRARSERLVIELF